MAFTLRHRGINESTIPTGPTADLEASYPRSIHIVYEPSIAPTSPFPFHPYAARDPSSGFSSRRSSVKTFETTTTSKSAVVQYAKHAKHLYDMPQTTTMPGLRVDTNLSYAQARLATISGDSSPNNGTTKKSSGLMSSPAGGLAAKQISARLGFRERAGKDHRISVSSVPEQCLDALHPRDGRRVKSFAAANVHDSPPSFETKAPMLPIPLRLTPPSLPVESEGSSEELSQSGSNADVSELLLEGPVIVEVTRESVGQSPSIMESAKQFPLPPQLRLSRLSVFAGLRSSPNMRALTSRWSGHTASPRNSSQLAVQSARRPLPDTPLTRGEETD